MIFRQGRSPFFIIHLILRLFLIIYLQEFYLSDIKCSAKPGMGIFDFDITASIIFDA
jgi:hypothetical protein